MFGVVCKERFELTQDSLFTDGIHYFIIVHFIHSIILPISSLLLSHSNANHVFYSIIIHLLIKN